MKLIKRNIDLIDSSGICPKLKQVLMNMNTSTSRLMPLDRFKLAIDFASICLGLKIN